LGNISNFIAQKTVFDQHFLGFKCEIDGVAEMFLMAIIGKLSHDEYRWQANVCNRGNRPFKLEFTASQCKAIIDGILTLLFNKFYFQLIDVTLPESTDCSSLTSNVNFLLDSILLNRRNLFLRIANPSVSLSQLSDFIVVSNIIYYSNLLHIIMFDRFFHFCRNGVANRK
jgi:hypothetical protein